MYRVGFRVLVVGGQCRQSSTFSIVSAQGCYSETVLHIGMGRNFVCLWHRRNCNWSLPFSADILIYEINYWVFKQSYLTCNNFYILNNFFTLSQQNLFCWIRGKFKTMLVSSFNLSQSFNYTPYLFYKNQFKSEINSFCIWTQLCCIMKRKNPSL